MVFKKKKPGSKKPKAKAKKDKKQAKDKKELKKLAELLSGKNVELRINENTVSMYVDKQFFCAFTGKIMAEDYRKEKAELDKREKSLNESEKRIINNEKELIKRENELKELKKLQKLVKLDRERDELRNSINGS